jgi:hypothetical protein
VRRSDRPAPDASGGWRAHGRPLARSLRSQKPGGTSSSVTGASAAASSRRTASGLDGLGSGWRAIQVSRAASAGGRRRTPTRWPLPVVTGRPRLFVLTPIDAMDFGLTRKRPGRKYPANPPGLTIPANRRTGDGYRASYHISTLNPRRCARRGPGEPRGGLSRTRQRKGTDWQIIASTSG